MPTFKVIRQQHRFFEIYYDLKKNRLDEAQSKLRKMRTDRLSAPSRLEYYALSGELKYKQSRLKAASVALSKALALAEELNEDRTRFVTNLRLLLGNACYQSGNYMEAYKIHRSLLFQVVPASYEQFQLFHYLGRELLVLGCYQESLRYYRKAARHEQITGFREEYAGICLGTAICYKQLDNYEHGLIFARRGLELALTVGNPDLLIRLHYIMGALFLLTGDIDQAERHQQEASKQAANPAWQAMATVGLAQVQAAKGDVATALETMAKAEALNPVRNNPFLGYTLADYAFTLSSQGYNEASEAVFEQGLTALKDGKPETVSGVVANYYYHYGAALEQQGDYFRALQCYKAALDNQKNGRLKVA